MKQKNYSNSNSNSKKNSKNNANDSFDCRPLLEVLKISIDILAIGLHQINGDVFDQYPKQISSSVMYIIQILAMSTNSVFNGEYLVLI